MMKLILCALLAFAPAVLTAPQYQVGQRSFYVPPSGPPAIPHPACFQTGASTSYTTGSVNTTGAGAVIVTISGFVVSSTNVTVTDNFDSTTLTNLTVGTQSTGSVLSWEAPSTTSTTATFTIASAGIYAYVCVLPITGVSGVYDGNASYGAYSGSTCVPGTITPGSGNHMVVTGFATSSGTTYTLSSPYTIAGQTAYSGAVTIGGGAGYYATGASTGPSWGGTATTGDTCSIASWH